MTPGSLDSSGGLHHSLLDGIFKILAADLFNVEERLVSDAGDDHIFKLAVFFMLTVQAFKQIQKDPLLHFHDPLAESPC